MVWARATGVSRSARTPWSPCRSTRWQRATERWTSVARSGCCCVR